LGLYLREHGRLCRPEVSNREPVVAGGLLNKKMSALFSLVSRER
jgi:hypothetical protein